MGDSTSGRSPETKDENYLQPLFVLHKASPQNSQAKPARRRKVDSSLGSPKRGGKVNPGASEEMINREEIRMETFKLVWSDIAANVKGVMKEAYGDSFQAISTWVQESLKLY